MARIGCPPRLDDWRGADLGCGWGEEPTKQRRQAHRDGLNVEVSLFVAKRRFIFMMILSKIFNPAKISVEILSE
jgi:hypothetical protein